MKAWHIMMKHDGVAQHESMAYHDEALALGWDAECNPAADETLARQGHWLGTWATQEGQVAGDDYALCTASALCTG